MTAPRILLTLFALTLGAGPLLTRVYTNTSPDVVVGLSIIAAAVLLLWWGRATEVRDATSTERNDR